MHFLRHNGEKKKNQQIVDQYNSIVADKRRYSYVCTLLTSSYSNT